MSETGPVMVTDPSATPDCEPHTPSPRGYLARAEWFGEMAAAGYVQRQCKGCELWMIWEPAVNPSAPAAGTGEDEGS